MFPKAAGILQCDVDLCWESCRIPKSCQLDPELLVFILWQLAVATNQQIGEKFGLTCASESQRVRTINKNINNDKELSSKYHHIKSLMKI